jgi:formylglycine-generating enzyme required for sulfatase activity
MQYNMLTKKITFFLCFSFGLFFSATAQKTSRLHTVYSCPGVVMATYHLESAQPTDVMFYYSGDGGTTWLPCDSVSGDLTGQTTGKKAIVWDMQANGVGEGFYRFKLEVPQTVFSCESEIVEMVSVAGGTFTMGQSGGKTTYGPVNATVSDFHIGKYEVTQCQFKQVMGITNTSPAWTSSYGLGDDYPAYYVSWYDAIAFCNKLSLMEGRTPVYAVSGVDFATLTYAQIPTSSNAAWNACTQDLTANGYRLPTETEWEYAARGGAGTGTYYAGTNTQSDLGDYAWYSANSSSTSHPVGTKQPNGLSIYDMSGNEYEWCWDWYGTYLGGTNPTGSVSGSRRVLRGGGWYNGVSFCRVSYRYSYYYPNDRYDFIGFRLCLSAE